MSPSNTRAGNDVGVGNVDLRPYDGRPVVVVLSGGGSQISFYGMGQFEHDLTLGNVLRICPATQEMGSPSIVISEQDWDGSIEALDDPKAEFRFMPSPQWPPHA